jgi:hypothetical protein
MQLHKYQGSHKDGKSLIAAPLLAQEILKLPTDVYAAFCNTKNTQILHYQGLDGHMPTPIQEEYILGVTRNGCPTEDFGHDEQ